MKKLLMLAMASSMVDGTTVLTTSCGKGAEVAKPIEFDVASDVTLSITEFKQLVTPETTIAVKMGLIKKLLTKDVKFGEKEVKELVDAAADEKFLLLWANNLDKNVGKALAANDKVSIKFKLQYGKDTKKVQVEEKKPKKTKKAWRKGKKIEKEWTKKEVLSEKTTEE